MNQERIEENVNETGTKQHQNKNTSRCFKTDGVSTPSQAVNRQEFRKKNVN